MENASKALIIAGSILLALLIIGLGMVIYNNVVPLITNTGLDQQEIAAKNATYENYIGDRIKGSRVKLLCDAVKNNNLTADESNTFTISINGVTEPTEINTLKATFASGKLYSVTLTYSATTKLVETITVTEAQ